jgi:hypothetical protein
MSRMPEPARERFEAELAAARRADDPQAAWAGLMTAHILSQSWAGPHVRSHVAMLRQALRARDPRETLGQVVRTVVAAPGSWTGRVPVGNTGRADMPIMGTLPVPPDLVELLR